MREEFGKVLSVSRRRFLPGTESEQFDKALKGRRIVFGDRAVGARVLLIGPERAFGKDQRAALFFVTIKETKFREIARRPATQFSETFELRFILSAPARRIGWFVGSLEFDKGPWWRALPHQGDVRPPNARISIFRDDDQPMPSGQKSKRGFEQLLKGWGESRFRDIRAGAPQFPDPPRIIL
jgi:hypothetical protein